MSQSVKVIRQDEFGGLDWLGLPGQDPALVQGMVDNLTAELNPRNVIERCWVRDIAIFTARLDFLRKAHWMIMACVMEDIALAEAKEIHANEPGWNARDDDLLALLRRITQGEDFVAGARDLRIQRLLPRAFAREVVLSEQLMRLEMDIAKERDRLYLLYCSRQQMQISEAVALLAEMGVLPSPASFAASSDGVGGS